MKLLSLLRSSHCHPVISIIIAFAAAWLPASGAVDLSQYDTGGTIAVTHPDSSTLVVRWNDKPGASYGATFNLDPSLPLLRSLEASAGGGAPVTVAGDVNPRFRVTLGKRRAQTSWPYIFFETIDTNQPAPVPHLSTLGLTGVKVISDSANRVRIVFEGLDIGPYRGELTAIIYQGSPFIHFQASMRVTDPWVSYIHDSLFYSSFQTVSYRDRFGVFTNRAASSLTVTTPGESAGLQVKHRAIMGTVNGGSGTLAVVSPPHACVYPTDFSTNFGQVQAGSGFIGTKMSFPGDGRYRPWVDAPQGSEQRMDVFLLISPANATATLDRVLPYTNGDTFKDMPGRKTLATHFHPEFTAAFRSGGDTITPFVAAMKAMNVDMVQPMEFHGPGNPFNNETQRLAELKDMFTLLQAHSDEELLLIPGEEYNEFFGEHWSYMFSKPVYFTGWPGQAGRTYRRENVVSGGVNYPVVYEVGDAANMLQLLKDEGGIAWTAHPRIKNSREMPDIYMNSPFYKDAAFQAGDWKSMPLDLSKDRLGSRGLELMNDTAQLGFRKHMLGEVDTFTLNPTHEIYAHMNVNYLTLKSAPTKTDWTSVVNSIRQGNFFTTTGEVLIHSWNAASTGVTAQVEWNFPPAFVEITWGDSSGIHRLKKPVPSGQEFSTGSITIDADLSSANWVRFEAWDIARNGAFTQPFWFTAPANPATVIGRTTGFTLFDSDTDAPVPGYDPIPEGAVLNRSTLPANLNIRANTVPYVFDSGANVSIVLDGGTPLVENGHPYVVGPCTVSAGLRGAPFFDYGPLALSNGNHVLTATPMRGSSPGTGRTLNFSVTGTPPPAVPAGVVASPSSTSVLLTWNAVAGATSYSIKRSTTNGGPYTEIASSPSNAFTDRDIVTGTTYYYVVSAAAVLESGNSAQVTAAPGVSRSVVGAFGQGVVAGADVPVGQAPGWSVAARTTSTGNVTDYTTSIPNPLDSPNIANNTGGANGTSGYLVMGARTVVNPIFLTLDTTVSQSGRRPASVSFYTRNNATDSTVKVAVRIGTNWYLSTQGFTDSGANATWMLQEFQVTSTPGAWISFDPATLLTGASLPGGLPSGPFTALGLLGQIPTTGKIRIDEVTLTTVTLPGIDEMLLGSFHEGVQVGMDVPVNQSGWSALGKSPSNGTVTDYSTSIPVPADTPNVTNNNAGAAGTRGYLVMGLNTLVNPVFASVDTTTSLAGSVLRSVSFQTKNNHAASNVKVAVRIGGAWYLSTQAFTDAGGNSVWTQHKFTFTTAAGTWQPFDTATLTAGVALSQPLPAGNITALGLLGTVPTSGKVRLDEVAVEVLRLTHFQQWQIAQYGSTDHPDAAPLATPYNDGVSNLIRYALGIPTGSPSAPSLPQVSTIEQAGSKYLTLTYTELANATDISYIVEIGDAPGPWNSGPAHTTQVSSIVNAPTRTVTIRDNHPISSNPHRFMRLKVLVDGTTGYQVPD